jgi:DNA-binding NarL/FixJ family response regulator
MDTQATPLRQRLSTLAQITQRMPAGAGSFVRDAVSCALDAAADAFPESDTNPYAYCLTRANWAMQSLSRTEGKRAQRTDQADPDEIEEGTTTRRHASARRQMKVMELVERITAAAVFEKLPLRCRDLLEMQADGMSREEIAAAHGQTLRWVQTQLQQTQRYLRHIRRSMGLDTDELPAVRLTTEQDAELRRRPFEVQMLVAFPPPHPQQPYTIPTAAELSHLPQGSTPIGEGDTSE